MQNHHVTFGCAKHPRLAPLDEGFQAWTLEVGGVGFAKAFLQFIAKKNAEKDNAFVGDGLWKRGFKGYAQDSGLIRDRPVQFVSYLDIGIGTTGGELGFSARVRKRLATDLFVKVFWNRRGSLSSLNSYFITGFKAKFYQNKSHNSFFAGPMAALHGFGSDLRPLLGLTIGFDHYTHSYVFHRRTEFWVGFFLEGGMDTEGDGYIGGGFSVGIGYYNSGKIRRNH